MFNPKYKKILSYTATHKAWFLLCPVYIADLGSHAPVPLPRFIPGWWLEFNFTLSDLLFNLMSSLGVEDSGYIFYKIKKLKKEKIISVKSSE